MNNMGSSKKWNRSMDQASDPENRILGELGRTEFKSPGTEARHSQLTTVKGLLGTVYVGFDFIYFT